MIAAGLPSDKVYVKPNYFPGTPTVIPWAERGMYSVFAGRLSEEKGVVALVKAWIAWGVDAPELRIVGDGPLRKSLQKAAIGSSIRFLGQIPLEETIKQIAYAKLLILPSEWFEGFPMVVREAFAVGTPSAVSNLGPLPTIVIDGINGIIFEAANPLSLLNTVQNTWHEPGLLKNLGDGARQSFEKLYTEEINYSQLMSIYQVAIERKLLYNKIV
jgi:glycosyltransferase involved in cell wall biosynthesis